MEQEAEESETREFHWIGRTNKRTIRVSASRVARTISPATQCGSRSWAEIIRFECTLAAAVGNSVISGHPAYNGYHNGIKHNASINVNNNRAAAGVTGRVDGASAGAGANVRGPFCTSATTTLETDDRSTSCRYHGANYPASDSRVLRFVWKLFRAGIERSSIY